MRSLGYSLHRMLLKSAKILNLSWKPSIRIAALTISVLTLAALMGCLRGSNTTTVLYSRSTQLPEELTGMMRLAQPEVKVNIVGSDGVGEFKTIEAASYLVLHEQDVATFVRNTKRLQLLVEHLQKSFPEALKNAPQIKSGTNVDSATAFLNEEE
jgi:hypothetical protein